MAAVLACGPGSLLSFRSGGGLQGLIKTSRSRIDVTTPLQVRRAGIHAHRCTVHPDDRAEVDGIPCTSVARTLLDLAAVVRAAQLQDALEQAEELGHFGLRAIEAVLKRNRGHRGVRLLRESLAALTVDDHLFRSKVERLFLPITRSAGMPEPLVNHRIKLPSGSIEVDFYWPALHLAVEADGYEFHRRRRSFAEDRRRDGVWPKSGSAVCATSGTTSPTLRESGASSPPSPRGEVAETSSAGRFCTVTGQGAEKGRIRRVCPAAA